MMFRNNCSVALHFTMIILSFPGLFKQQNEIVQSFLYLGMCSLFSLYSNTYVRVFVLITVLVIWQ